MPDAAKVKAARDSIKAQRPGTTSEERSVKAADAGTNYTGVAGPAGPTGASSTVTGPTGPTGPA